MDKYELIIEEAKKARLNAYSPYSEFKVGAALMTKDGKIYHGCNVENISYGLTNCAERTCLFSAVAAGVKKEDIVLFCVVGQTEDPISPCGACRQVMAELLDQKCEVVMANLRGKYKLTTVEELLPFGFKEIENVF